MPAAEASLDMGDGRVLFLYENEAPFVRDDLAILRERFDVVAFDCSRGTTVGKLWRPLRWADLSYSWFALGYAARAVLLGGILRRPSIVVAGGWDVLSMPEIGYGAVRSRRGRRRARYVCRHADRVLAFSEFSRRAILDLSGRDPDLVYLGVDVERFRPGTKEDLVVSVGHVTMANLRRKGMETFVRAAGHVPDVPFVLAGKQDPEALAALRKTAPPNVTFPGHLSDDDLRNLLARAKVYAQVSYNEGFGLAVAEAMASECVPVVTRAGSLPEVAGEVGLYVRFGDAVQTGQAILEALTSNRGVAARQRVASQFPASRRRERVLGIAEALLGR